jgi:SH3 domain-containing YSC84-like protein 1
VRKRVEKAVEALDSLTDSSGRYGIRPEEFAMADCVAVIPAFEKGAAVVGVSFGRGFLSCRSGESWSAPAAVTLQGGSLEVQIGGEVIDIVVLAFLAQISRGRDLVTRVRGMRCSLLD